MLPPLYPKMPTKQVTYRNDKAVLVRVYVEKPREKRSSSPSIQHHHHHHHYHIHRTVRQEVVHHGSAGKGYDRRSGLLMYSRLLRDSARGSSSTPLLPKWFANNNLQPPTQMAAFKKKPEQAGRPACFGNWKLLIPSFLRSWSNAQKKEKKKKQMHGGFSGNGIKKLQVRRGKGFIPKVFLTTCKCA